MARFADEGICIRQWDWSETSQTVSIFTREHGMVRGLAKGARREKGAFSGGIEMLTRGEILGVQKEAGKLSTLTNWTLRETYPAVRTSLPAFHAAMYMADVVQHLMSVGDPHPGLFDALATALRRLAEGPPEPAVLALQWAALDEAGYRPELQRDVHARTPLETAPTYLFDARRGGLRRDLPGAGALVETWRVRSETVEVLRALEARCTDGEQHPPGEPAARASRLLHVYLRSLLGRELPSAEGCFGPASG